MQIQDCSLGFMEMGPANSSSAHNEFIVFTTSKDIIPMSYEESISLSNIDHAAHCMIYALTNTLLFASYNPKAAILMQMRHDGKIGFPGGRMKSGEDLIDSLNREMVEEINLDLSKHRAIKENHIISHVNHQKGLVTHFFAFEVSLDEFKTIEKRCLGAEDYGEETLGILRPCLYTMNDNKLGFPSFLKNNFVGNCKEQLCQSLRKCGIMSEKDIRTGLKLSQNIKKD